MNDKPSIRLMQETEAEMTEVLAFKKLLSDIAWEGSTSAGGASFCFTFETVGDRKQALLRLWDLRKTLEQK